MSELVQMLGAQRDRIVAAAYDACEDDVYEDAISGLFDGLLIALPSETPIDASPLGEAGANEAMTGRILRAIQSESIEVLRESCPSSTFGQAVLDLRAIIARALPVQPVVPWCAELAETLRSEDSSGPTSRNIVDFFRCVTSTIRDMVYAHDVNGNMFYINDSGLGMIGYSRDDLKVGMSVYDFVVPDHLDLVEARLESPGAVLRAPYSIEIYARDGERIPIEIDTRPLLGDDDEVVGVVGIARDLRLERRLQTQIQRTNAHLEHILAAAPMGILRTDQQGVIVDANAIATGLVGAPNTNALIGLHVAALGSEGNPIETHANATLQGGREIGERVHFKTRYGSMLKCDMLLTPQHEDSGAVSGLLVLLIDVAEQIALQQSLAQHERLSALGQIIAGVAHEINNPLTGILGYAQYLLQTTESETTRERLQQIVEESQRCRRVVDNLLSFADAGQTEKRAADVNSLVREIVDLYEYQLRMDSIRMDLELGDDLPQVNLAAQEVQRVFLNLISNAHQALCTVDGRERALSIRSYVENGKVHVVVGDNGPGVSEGDQSRVFDPFFTTHKQGEGMGLGLSVSYGIVQDHGGQIVLESTPGEGASFIVTFPIHE
ncbi:MAG: PAS domain S-box protein [bacterium]|nr:PAS domain S-box protein [bacterium]